jgi:arsenate reductase
MTKMMQDKPKVLFVCTGNSCRSQMAEGMLKHYGNGEFEVYSAGLRPSHVHPLAIKALAELDIDITNQYSKTVNEFIGQEFSYVVTVCGSAKELCPVFPGKYNALHWSIEDPASTSGTEEEMMKVFRKVRQNILEKVKHFVTTNKAG